MILAEGRAGTATGIVDSLPDRGQLLWVAATEATRARPGGISEQIGLDDLRTGTVVVDQAQWADASSLGRLQRVLEESDRNVAVVLAFRGGADAWAVTGMADALSGRIPVHRVTVADGAEAEPLEQDLAGADLVVAVMMAGQAVSVPVAARLLGVTEAEALSIAEDLVARGYLVETRSGFSCARRVKVGEARKGYVAARLADVMESLGRSDSVVASLRLAAGDNAGAYPLLVASAHQAAGQNAQGEAYILARSALQAGEAAGLGDDEEIGGLHLLAARYLRNAGRSEAAGEAIEAALPRLSGVRRIDALGFFAAIADDRQHPQDAEIALALAEVEAVRLGELGKLGSLMSLRARAIHRIGFTDEADFCLDRAVALIDRHATKHQRFTAGMNRAWIHFDRGEMARAELEFTRLRDEAEHLEGIASLADKEAWLARALFGAGKPDEALESVRRAEELAARSRTEAPIFIAEIAMAEGGILYGRPQLALEASERVLDLVERQLPAWENMARCLKAQALRDLGRLDEAAGEIERALAVTPAGANGWRWRVRCRAVQIEIDAARGERWPDRQAEDLTDLLLQSKLYGWATEALIATAYHGGFRDAAREATALAVHIGNPNLAARAASVGKLWKDPIAAPVIRAVRHIDERIPEEWGPEWRALPAVSAGLAADERGDAEDTTLQADLVDFTLREAGLRADQIDSPAQRRAGKLVKRRRKVRRIQLVAATLAVVVLAAGTAVAVNLAQPEAPPATVTVQVTAPTTTVPLRMEETAISLPADIDRVAAGVTDHRGGPDRSGYFDVAGPARVDGYYWQERVVGLVQASPVAYGNNLLVATTDGILYALDLSTGRVHFTMPNLGRISAAPAIGRLGRGEGQVLGVVVVVSENGFVHARDAVFDNPNLSWSARHADSFVADPAIDDDVVVVVSTDGQVMGLELANGDKRWDYLEGESLGPVSAGISIHDGIAYVGTEAGEVHLIQVATGEPVLVCQATGPIVGNVILSGDAMYVPTRTQSIHVLPHVACSGLVPDRFPFPGYPTFNQLQVAPAIVGDRIYIPDGTFLEGKDLVSGEFLWESSFGATRPISTPPVVDREAVYFGSEDGYVYALDLVDGVERWRFDTGAFVRAAPLVVNGIAYVVSGDGMVYAIGPR